MAVKAAEDDRLAKFLAWLGTPDCRCDSEWRSLGVLHGVSMGRGWVRMTTDPQCPHHGQSGRR